MNQPGEGRRKLAEEGITAELFRTEPDRRTALTAGSREALQMLARRSGRSGRLSPLGYNLTISHRHRFMWFRVAKVATRTILGHFNDQGLELDVHHAMRMRYPTMLFEDYFKFGFVRHPLDRFISAWRNKVHDHNYFEFDDATLPRMRTIEHFAEWTAKLDLTNLAEADHHLALQTRLLDLSHLDFLGRLETFDEDFTAICGRLGVPDAAPEVRNRSSPGAVTSETASEDLRAIVTEVYRRDFQVLGY